MGPATQRSTVTMPAIPGPHPSILDFLCHRFPNISREAWEERIAEGKVLGEDERPIQADTPFSPGQRLFYFRENADEPVIPGEEEILFADDHLLAADKPHFLPVNPAGPWVEQCLLARLRRRTGLVHLAPIHRIDRETAGVVLFSVNPATRDAYAALFREGKVDKLYEALSAAAPFGAEIAWRVEDRLERGEPWFRMKSVPGPVNARTRVQFVETRDGLTRFLLRPLTGKKHQLRVHMASLGFPIENDRTYPELQPQRPDDFARPLKLLARAVRFLDPVTGEEREFESERELG